ncbi:MAG: filamentous hemagglutinin family protein [Rubrivivax sp.]|nr:filamentous hemagglutinin family protein [Rubrivivax sp.]
MRIRRSPSSCAPRCAPLAVAVAASLLPLAVMAQQARVGPVPRAAAMQPSAPLPVLSSDAARVAGNAGQFSVATNAAATQLTVTQTSQRAIVNWDSFNVAAGRTVQFQQPSAQASTLNRIHDANPSVIQGSIKAPGEVLLENRNGLIFGATARVDTGRFVATALRTADAAFLRGIRAGQVEPTPAFGGSDVDRAGFVSFERGAEVRAAAGGDVLVFAPRVVNEGRIETPDGQTVLGAGRDVYLTASADPAQRGVVVRIQPFGGDDPALNTVTQAEARRYFVRDGQTVASAADGAVERINAIVAERGSINLVGLAIRQNGVLSATTAVKGRNGSIVLQAQRALGVPLPLSPTVVGETVNLPRVDLSGSVALGPEARIEILPDTAPLPRRNPDDPPPKGEATQFDSETFYRSRVAIEGQDIVLASGSVVRATGGSIEILASAIAPDDSRAFNPASTTPNLALDPSRIVVSAGATLDASGERDVALAMERHQGRLSLFQNELADSPLQRDGPLYRQELWFDLRNRPGIANVAGAYATLPRTARELSSSGGTVSLRADGAVVVDQGARLDVSGGSLSYAAGTVQRSLVRDGAAWILADRANPETRYDEFGNSSVRNAAGTALFQTDHYPAYVEARSAGTIELVGRRTWLGGTLAAGVTPVAAETLRLGNPFAASAGGVAAQGGRLVLGRSNDLGNVLAEVRIQTQPASRPDAFFADPLAADLDTQLTARLDFGTGLLAGGTTRLAVNATTQAELAPQARLDLGAGGELRLDALRIRLDGEVHAPGGRIEARTRSIAGQVSRLELGSLARLDVAGRWWDVGSLPDRPDRLALDGGVIALDSAASLVAAAGAVLDVSGGAQRAGQRLTFGRAGSVELGLNSGVDLSQSADLAGFADWQATMSGYDAQRGGRLRVAGLPGLSLGGRNGDAGFDDAFFNGRGFGSITLSALGDVRLNAGLDLGLQMSNWRADRPLDTPAANGRFLAAAPLALASQRLPVSLSLVAARTPVRTGADATYRVAPASLTMAESARIATEPGGRIDLAATGSVVVAGRLLAPGGHIGLTITGRRGADNPQSPEPLGFDASQALWLRPGAVLSVAGTTVLALDAQGRTTGNVFGGGSVSLNAQRGYIVAEAGATLDLRGAASPTPLFLPGDAEPQVVSRPGGTLSLASPEGMHLAATIQAQAADARAEGGRLDLALSLNTLVPVTGGPAYPNQPERELRWIGPEQGLPAFAASPGDDLVAALGNGLALLPQAGLQAAGFAQIALRADERISFSGNQTLAASGSLVLNAPVVSASADSEVLLRAQHIAIGDARRDNAVRAATRFNATGGAAVLEVRAGLVEAWGDLVFQGLKSVALNATLDADGGSSRRDGEVRLIGTTRGAQANTASGSIRFADELQFTAGQVLATTMSEFVVTGNAAAQGKSSTLGVFAPAGGSLSQTPLSAGATLSMQATDMRIDGVLRQPFGRIDLQAERLVLGANAMLSASGEGQTVPLGTTVNGRLWQYRPQGAGPGELASIRQLDGLPVAKGLSLNATTLEIAPQARLVAEGGGELQAWEFVAGVGGSRDVLAQPGRYALLPARNDGFAPYDAEVANSAGNAAPRPGSLIEIRQSTPALAAGRYTLLPARYALLPGAVLVSLAPGGVGSPLAEPVAGDIGGFVVDARLGQLGSSTAGTPWQRWVVEPQSVVLSRSRIDRTPVSELLASTAARLDRDRPALPRDGGRITLQASQPLAFDARLVLGAGTPAANGPQALAGELDIAVQGTNSRIFIVDRIGQQPEARGHSEIALASLNDSGGRSLLVGGRRGSSPLADGSLALDTLSSRVTLLADDAPLAAPELLLLARDEVRLAPQTAVESGPSGGNPADDDVVRRWQLRGNGALLLVSQAADSDVTRSTIANDTAAGGLNVGAGVQLQGRSARLVASGPMGLDNTLALAVDDLGVSAQRLGVGGGNAADGTTVLAGPLLQSMQQVRSLSFGAAVAVDFYGSQTLQAERLRLDAPLVRGIGPATDRVVLNAGRVELRNGGGTADATARGDAGLRVEADTLVIGADPGSSGSSAAARQRLAFGSVELASRGEIVFQGQGGLDTEAPTELSARRLTANTGAVQGVDSGNAALTVRPASQAGDSAALVDRGQGASLVLAGGRVRHEGEIHLPSGRLEIVARGADASPAAADDSLLLAAGSRIDLGGSLRRPGGGAVVAYDAGTLNLVSERGDVRIAGGIGLDAPTGAGPDALAGAGSLNISAVAGSLSLAPEGRLSAQVAGLGRGGRFTADVARVEGQGPAGSSTLEGLAGVLDRGGFDDRIALRVRTGDAALGDATLRAGEISVAVDAGALTLSGRIAADAPGGGRVRLWSRDDLNLAASVQARSTRSGANGGDVQAGSALGSVRLQTGLAIDARGDSPGDGRIVLRSGRDDDSGRVAVERDAGLDTAAALSAAEVIVEAVRRYEGATRIAAGASNGSTLGQATLLADAEAFAATHGAAELARLGLDGQAQASLRPGVEVVATGALELASDWNLYNADRSQPGMLTLRAAGGLRLNGSLSDGFLIAGRPANADAQTLAQAGPAWSLRLVAGADLAAADPLAAQAGAAADLVVANNRVVRTTAGSIELAAARDIVLASGSGQQAVVYATGRPDAPELAGVELSLPGSRFSPQFTAQGGLVSLGAGRDVIGAPTTQTWGNWFYRSGSTGDLVPVAWMSSWDAFRQGVASFGGGALSVRAGRDVFYLGAASPSSGVAPALDPDAADPRQGPVSVFNGGDLSVEAGRDVRGGTYLLGRGQGRIEAGRDVSEEALPNTGGRALPTLGPVLGLMDGAWQVTAQRHATLGPVVNPTVLPSPSGRIADSEAGVFFSYSERSALAVRSAAGDVAWRSQTLSGPEVVQYWSSLASNNALPANERAVWSPGFAAWLAAAPPRVSLSAGGGDLELSLAGLTLYPSASSLLQLAAAEDLRIVSRPGADVGLRVSSLDPAAVPGVADPVAQNRIAQGALPGELRPAPTRAAEVGTDALPGRVREPVRLQAGGDIVFGVVGGATSGDNSVFLSAPQAIELRAGGDILNPNLFAEHRAVDERSGAYAGGSIVQQGGALDNRITLAGPGQLRLEAGRQIDLGGSQGVESVGNLFDARLPGKGADIVLAAGQRSTVDVDRFVGRYLAPAPAPGGAAAAAGADPALALAERQADAYLVALGRDPAALTADDRTLRAELVDAHRAQNTMRGLGSAAALDERRADFVRLVRAAQGLVPLANAAAEAAAYDAHLVRYRAIDATGQASIAESLLQAQFARAYLAPGRPHAKLWTAAAEAAGQDPTRFEIGSRLLDDVVRQALFAELRRAGSWGAVVPASAPEVRRETYGLGFGAIDLAGQGDSQRFAGDIDLVASGVQTRRGGSVTMLAPGGQINVGLPGATPVRQNALLGVVTVGESGVSALSDGDFQVNSQRVFVVGSGDVTVWSSNANIDAGRGANTAISSPPLVARRQADASIGFELPAVTSGSGIGILAPPTGAFEGSVFLFAPNGEVLALDAQIRAPGRVTLGATVVRGADNVQGGSVVGAAIVVPTASVSVPASAAPSTAGLGNAASGGTTAAPRERATLLLLELLGLGPEGGSASEPAACEPGESEAACEARRRAGRR